MFTKGSEGQRTSYQEKKRRLAGDISTVVGGVQIHPPPIYAEPRMLLLVFLFGVYFRVCSNLFTTIFPLFNSLTKFHPSSK